MIPFILIITVVFTCAFVALLRPSVGVIAFYGFYLLQPEWNWRWTPLQSFTNYQDLLAISTLLGTLLNFGSGNVFTKSSTAAYSSLAGFLALAYVSYIQSINPTASWIYLNIIWKGILMAFLAAYHLDTPRRLCAMLWTISLAQGYNAYQINLQYFEDGYSLFARMASWGMHGDNNIYTNTTIPILACSAALMVYARRSWQKCLAASVALLQVHQIMLLESRGGMLGAIVTIGVFYSFMPKSPRVVAIGIATFIVGAVLAGPPVIEEFASAFRSRGELDSSALSRFDLWKAGWQITFENPLLGVGPNAGRYLVPNYVVVLGTAKDLHNIFFEVSCGCGIPAAVLFVSHFAIVWFGLFRLYRRTKTADELHHVRCAALAGIAGIPGLLVANMFSGGAMIETNYLLAAIGAAAICVGHRLQPEPAAVAGSAERSSKHPNLVAMPNP